MATLGSRLRSARASAFVGRDPELSLFRRRLEQREPAILWIYAPGGTGKSTLLREYAELARASDAMCVEIDLASIDASPTAILGELEPLLTTDRRAVLLFDSYERALAIDGWFRETLLAALPADVIVVIAGRSAPAAEWKTDPGALSILHALELKSFDRETSRALLSSRGIAEDRVDQLVAMSHGHALTLVLLAEVLRAPDLPTPSSLRDVPGVVVELVRRLVREIPSESERRTLEICAHARTTTEDLLQELVGKSSAHDLMRWLIALPFAAAHRDGVRLHPIVRDAIDQDLRWRDPRGYRELHLAVASHLERRLQSATDSERERAFLDLFYLRRVSAFARRFVDFETLGSGWAETPRADEREVVVELVEAHEGPRAAEIAGYWFDRQREAFTVLRSPVGDPIVASMHLVLCAIPEDARTLDPALARIDRLLESQSGLRPGERIVVSRFSVGHDPTSDGRVRHYRPMLLWLTTPNLAFAFSALSDGERWAPAFTEIGHRREAEFTIGDRTAPIFVGDYRTRSPSEWLRAMMTRDLEETPSEPAEPKSAREVGLDREALGAALRHALDNFTRSDQLRSNALLRSRSVRSRAADAEPSHETLRRTIQDAVDILTQDPRDAKLARALDAAYLHPAPTRELAAERIDVPFSTFRRRLAKAIERMEEILWSMEIDDR